MNYMEWKNAALVPYTFFNIMISITYKTWPWWRNVDKIAMDIIILYLYFKVRVQNMKNNKKKPGKN